MISEVLETPETEKAEQIAHVERALKGLRAARDSGALRVRHGEIETTYRSITELQTAITINEMRLGELQGWRKTRSYIITSRKGL